MEFDPEAFKVGDAVIFLYCNSLKLGTVISRKATVKESWDAEDGVLPRSYKRNYSLTYDISAYDPDNEPEEYSCSAYLVFKRDTTGMSAAVSFLEKYLAEIEQ